jgi:hypothetical protein
MTLGLVCAYAISRWIVYQRPRGKRQQAEPGAARRLVSWVSLPVLACLFILPGIGSQPPNAISGAALAIFAVTLMRILFGEFCSRRCFGSWFAFLAGEAVQLMAVAVAGSIIFATPDPISLVWERLGSPRTHALILVYALSLGIGGALVPMVTSSLAADEDAAPRGSLEGAGRLIGFLERLIITTLIIFWPKLDAAAIGLILSAKSIARFPEFKKPGFAEYYLVGSLTSFAVAIFASMIGRFWLPPH